MADLNQSSLLDSLNESQRAAVEYCDGALLVIAGAGSGKTRVLTYKIAYLIGERHMIPWRILALTFTNKAAKEMKDRIGRLIGHDEAVRLQMGTFHSVFARILRAEATQIGFRSNFTIYDQNDSRSLIKAIIKEMGLDEKAYKPASVGDRISMAKNKLFTARQYADSSAVAVDKERKMPAVKDIYLRYAERCRQANAMDFDDLLLYTYLLFKEHEEVRLKYSERFDYVLVDEYQDTNYAQQMIVQQISREKQRVCVVGDDAQSIYSFRGANIDNILDFQKIYPEARLFKLEQNYRSTQAIVQVANSLIRHNQRQIPKQVFSENETGEKLLLKPAYSDKEEAMIVADDIQRFKLQDGGSYGDFAILYRTNSQSRSFEEYLRKKNIPYKIYGGLSFYQRKEIKDIIAYFRLVANPDDEEALKRIINYPARGIGATTLNKVVALANSRGESLWHIVDQPAETGLDVSKATQNKLTGFCRMVTGWMEKMVTMDAYELGQVIMTESGISKEIYNGQKDAEALSRQENVEEFLAGLQDFVASGREEDMGDHVNISDFLQEVSLLTDLDSEGEKDEPKVHLMTIHSAKGLEFKTVFVVGLEENLFPSPMCVDSPRALEEERRLLYVAITRAEKRCVLTCAQNRFRYGRMEFDTPSRFIRELDSSKIKLVGGSSSLTGAFSYMKDSGRRASASGLARRVQSAGMGSHAASADVGSRKPMVAVTQSHPVREKAGGKDYNEEFGIGVGSIIEHQRFGIGEVKRLENSGENSKATVVFRHAGEKQLLLKFARFKVLS